MTANLTQKVTQASDIIKIEELMKGILGELCWKAHLSYGDELRLEIGERLPYLRPAMVGKEKGSWMLGGRGSGWTLDSQGKTLVSSNDPPALIEQRIHDVEDAKITAYKIGYPELDLIITFSNELILHIIPIEDSDSLLANWELFTPHTMLLKVGPDGIWSYIRSDLPESS